MTKYYIVTEEQMTQLQACQSITFEPPKPKPEQWEPEGGEWVIDFDGELSDGGSYDGAKKFGMERSTREAAEKARDAMRTHNRLLAYVEEFGDEWKADWDDTEQSKWNVRYNHSYKQWVIDYNDTHQSAGTVYMSKDCAEGLIRKLKSGEVCL